MSAGESLGGGAGTDLSEQEMASQGQAATIPADVS